MERTMSARKRMVREVAVDWKRRWVTTWLEILKEVRNQWEVAEHERYRGNAH